MENAEHPRYTWTGFYSEFADKLLSFRDNRPELIAKIQRTYDAIGMKLPTLEAGGVPADIDPFTVFGTFNKQMTDVNRKRVAAGYADEFGVIAASPQDFDGIPLLNNQNATFYAFSNNEHRDDADIDRLWRLFEAALTYADHPNETNEREFSVAYDDVRSQYGIGWKTTMGLFWIRPFVFVNLDSRNRWYFEQPGVVPATVSEQIKRFKKVPKSSDFLRLRDLILEAAESGDHAYRSFPELSRLAWLTSEEENKRQKSKEKTAQESSLGDADVETTRYWLYAPGDGASEWDSFFNTGTMAIGWDKIGDLTEFGTKEEIRTQLQDSYGDKTSQSNSALALWQFSHEMKAGDVVFVKKGRYEILGRGVVTGEYEFRPEYGQFSHCRKVEWGARGNWSVDKQLPMKTLTEFTDYPQAIAQIESLFESNEGESEELEEPLVQYPEYSKELFLDEVFMDEDAYDMLVQVLQAKKNIILQGAPGVGKTFVAKRLAYSMMGVKDTRRVMMVQFHQSYSYEDFIEGYRPTSQRFELARGAFYSFCKKGGGGRR